MLIPVLDQFLCGMYGESALFESHRRGQRKRDSSFGSENVLMQAKRQVEGGREGPGIESKFHQVSMTSSLKNIWKAHSP